jgi:uncharacterized damage-inducible protein DinB
VLSKDDATRLFEYNVWANHRLLRAAATLSVEDFKRDVLAASHGGVRGTLAHILFAEWIWLERWKGVSHTRGIDEGEFADVVALRDRWTLIERHREEWLGGLRAESLGEIVHYRTIAGVAYQAPLGHLVQHALNHSTYHRGQVALMLRALKVRPVATDLVLWDRTRGPEGPGADD